MNGPYAKHFILYVADQHKSDDQLLENLLELGIQLDREKFAELSQGFFSAEALAKHFSSNVPESNFFNSDWLWICLSVLWERCCPERPSFEMIDDEMQQGYSLVEQDKTEEAVEAWLRLWKKIKAIMGQAGFYNFEDFDSAFGGTQFVSNGVQDVQMHLSNLCIKDREWCHQALAFCDELVGFYGIEDILSVENVRRAKAEAYAHLGDMKRVDSLFEEWLGSDREWGWGWIGWSDCYVFINPEVQDHERGLYLLKKGLVVPDVRDRVDILDRIIDICREMGKEDVPPAIKAPPKK